MKKFLTLSIAAMLIASAVSGCGNKPSESADDQAEDISQSAVETVADIDEITQKGTLTVGITLFAPMNYYDDNGELIGFDTDLTKAVCEKLGVTPDFQEINWDSKEIELNSKNIDCIWNGMCITDERKENMSMSSPYLKNTQAMVMKADVAEQYAKDPSGASVVAEQGSTGEGKLQGTIPDDETVVVSAKEFFANSTYTAVDSMAKAIMEVASGTADIALVDSVCAYGMVGEGTDYPDLVVNTDNEFGAQEYGIAFRKGSDLCAKVDEIIAELTADGTVAEIAAKYNLSDMLISK